MILDLYEKKGKTIIINRLNLTVNCQKNKNSKVLKSKYNGYFH